MPVNFTRAQRIALKGHPELTERWVQEQIAIDPSILGLGDLDLKDKERVQPRAGRLDLLLQDSETKRRYEVEVQLGRTDESHIVRTLEYWDIERKRYPQYDHCAVIIAEDITSRFLNVIGLFNGMIPLIALQMSALRVGTHTTLVFTTVMGEVQFGLVEEDEEVQVATDRAFWEAKASKTTVSIVDELLGVVLEFATGMELKYNKHYIGLSKDGHADNFLSFRPRKTNAHLELRIDRSDDLDARIDAAGLDVLEYDRRWRRYRIRLGKGDVKKHHDFLLELMKLARGEVDG